MPKQVTPATVASLLDKGNGILVKRNGVWTYPNAPNDRSGTNLVLPVEFLPDAVVQEAIGKGDVVSKSTDVSGTVTAVTRPPADGVPVRIVNMMQAGSVEAATELPLNSRPTHDAGRSDREVDASLAQSTVDAPKAPTPSGPIAAAAPVALAPAPAVAKP